MKYVVNKTEYYKKMLFQSLKLGELRRNYDQNIMIKKMYISK